MYNLEQEYEVIKKMNYEQLVIYLKDKYGEVPYPYFYTKSCKSKQRKNSRTSDGLFIHHILEDNRPDLSNKDFAIYSPWEYQLPGNLVYANLIEHSMLHCLISEKTDSKGLGVGYFDLTMDFAKGIRDNVQFKTKYKNVIAKQIRPYFYILEDIFKRVGYPILTPTEEEQIKIEREMNEITKFYYIEKKDLIRLKELANYYLQLKSKDAKRFPRSKIIECFDYFYSRDDSKEKYINYNRDQLIHMLDSLSNKIIKTKSQSDYDRLIRSTNKI